MPRQLSDNFGHFEGYTVLPTGQTPAVKQRIIQESEDVIASMQTRLVCTNENQQNFYIIFDPNKPIPERMNALEKIQLGNNKRVCGIIRDKLEMIQRETSYLKRTSKGIIR